MTRLGGMLLRAVVVFAAMLAALALGMEGETVRAAADPAPSRVTNSLTTQFPLGRQRLCCTSKPHRRAATPARPTPTVSRTTSVSSSTTSGPRRAARGQGPRTARSARSRTTSQQPLLGQHGGGSAAPFIVVGAVIVACLVAAELGRLSVRRRRRARRRDRAAAARAVAQPAAAVAQTADAQPAAAVAKAVAQPAAAVAKADAQPAVRSPEAAPSQPAPFQRTDAPLRTAPDPAADVPSRAAPDPAADVPSRAAPDPGARESPALAGSSDSEAADEEPVAGPLAADEKHSADPLAQLEREILERGAAARAAAEPRRSQPGEGTYRLGQVLYERGRLQEAAAAWRLAASKRHPKAAARLAELLEETGDTDARS